MVHFAYTVASRAMNPQFVLPLNYTTTLLFSIVVIITKKNRTFIRVTLCYPNKRYIAYDKLIVEIRKKKLYQY